LRPAGLLKTFYFGLSSIVPTYCHDLNILKRFDPFSYKTPCLLFSCLSFFSFQRSQITCHSRTSNICQTRNHSAIGPSPLSIEYRIPTTRHKELSRLGQPERVRRSIAPAEYISKETSSTMSLIPPNSLLPDFSGPPSSGPVVIMDPAGSPVPLATGPNAYLVSIFGIVAIVLNYVPSILLYRAKNIPACTTIVVIVVMNFFVFLNAIIWPNNNTSTWWDGAGLCDIEVYIRSMCATLIATATAGLTRNLAQAVDADNPRLYESAAQRRRRYVMEILFCFGIPASQLVTYYFIQAGRYAVLTVFGCVPIVDNSWPTLVLFLIWPPIFALLNCYYASKLILDCSTCRNAN
jgi:hypothetical protein